jgi:quercetin dioxygenase-like cupin family protein
VVNLPSGVLRSLPGRIEDTTVLAYNIKSTVKDARASVVRGKDNPPAVIEAGEKAGQGGAKVSVQRYVYDGNSIRVAQLSGPGKNSTAVPKVDALIYLLSGRMNLHLGDEIFEVRAGDALREPAGIPVYWDILEPSSFIATNGVAP